MKILTNNISKKQVKIFCVSFQRTGTTSVGQFFKDHGFKVAGYDRFRSEDWSAKRFLGDYESIFKSKEFIENQVFEDNPWWENDFYKVLYHRFPKAKFVLFIRDSDEWFNSMIKHSQGKSLGNTFLHSKLYRREKEFYQNFSNLDYYQNMKKADNLLNLNNSHREHYKTIYNIRNQEVQDFFNQVSISSLFVGKLEDDKKWEKLGQFMNIEVREGYNVHVNRSNS